MAHNPQASNKKATSSVQDVNEDKPPFGSRFLTDEQDVWSQNAWDHVPPPDDQDEAIAKSLSKQRSAPVPDEEKVRLNEKPAKHWDNFYKMNAANFFRNRKWLHNEFPELVASTTVDAGPVTIVEIGCGAGNSVFPLLAANKNPALSLHAYDYANHAVKLVQNDPLYLSPPVGKIHASVWDVTSPDGIPDDIVPGTVDIVIMVFVMSALHPNEWGRAINNVQKILKPGGHVLFRDYGRYDLTQLRFKGGRLLDENFYIRGDKTRVYFFELDELSLLFTGAKASSAASQPTDTTTTEVMQDGDEGGVALITETNETEETSISDPVALTSKSGSRVTLPDATEDGTEATESHVHQTPKQPSPTASLIHPNLLAPLAGCPAHPLFVAEQLGVDRRLIVNRKRQLKMYRVWMQGKFQKL
ncbi:hypothetical protein D9619_006243 [Psilocybe cf. subviscida]|uniref:tRNA N(3)-methylcytidine methyltransferase n=1 Tax=Psilocybe cf. subviscida TaxID=2480587 RepID=A0A8H5B4K3_9AGAR|nr:hypothetical protein D9619_006243 [Psilocybe cf. subviscida]